MSDGITRFSYNDIYIVPDGLHELLADISREVLRNQPENLYDFITQYLDAMLVTREILQIEDSLIRRVVESVPTKKCKRPEFLKYDSMEDVENDVPEIITLTSDTSIKSSLEKKVDSFDDKPTSVESHQNSQKFSSSMDKTNPSKSHTESEVISEKSIKVENE